LMIRLICPKWRDIHLSFATLSREVNVHPAVLVQPGAWRLLIKLSQGLT